MKKFSIYSLLIALLIVALFLTSNAWAQTPTVPGATQEKSFTEEAVLQMYIMDLDSERIYCSKRLDVIAADRAKFQQRLVQLLNENQERINAAIAAKAAKALKDAEGDKKPGKKKRKK